jgi:hypothetical protein
MKHHAWLSFSPALNESSIFSSSLPKLGVVWLVADGHIGVNKYIVSEVEENPGT